MNNNDTKTMTLNNRFGIPLSPRQIMSMIFEFEHFAHRHMGPSVHFESAMMHGPKGRDYPDLSHDNPSYPHIKGVITRINDMRVHIRTSTSDDFSRYGASSDPDYKAIPGVHPSDIITARGIADHAHICLTARDPERPNRTAKIDFGRRVRGNAFLRETGLAEHDVSVIDLMAARHPWMRRGPGIIGNAELVPLVPSARLVTPHL